MKEKESNKRHILVRYLIVIAMMLLMAGAIIFNLFRTSVTQAGKWNAKADKVLNSFDTLPPERGKILADNGTVLAANLTFYTARIDWTAAGISVDTLKHYLPALADSLAAFDPSKTAEQWRDELLAAATAKKKSTYYRLARDLTHAQFERLKTFPWLNLRKNKNGFYYEPSDRRVKPYGAMASRSIGFVGKDSLSAFNHGRAGLEKALDSLLFGKPGVKGYVQLTSNIVSWESEPAVRGYDITTTISVELQDIVEGELYKMCHDTDAEWGTCILMEVATGEIKAISNLEWNEAAGDYIEGVNHAVLGYEPGSVMKPISMMVALEEGVVGDINTPIPTGTSFMYYGKPINDPHGGAALTPRQIIETSSNVGMSKITIKRYGDNPGGWRERLAQMGFFEPFNTGIAGEMPPQIPKIGNSAADHVALTRMCYGYTTLIPPMYTLAMYNAIANDGKFVRPHLVKKLSREGEPDSIIPITYIRKQVCSPENAQKLRVMLHDVVWGNRGTARKWVQDPDVEIAGKTGTAYVNKNGQYGTQKRLAFCGFFPYENPKYSCMVLMLGANVGAGASSGMVLRNVAKKMYARGWLGFDNNYAHKETVTDAKHPEKEKKEVAPPTFYATTDPKRNSYVKRSIGARQSKVIKTPAKPVKGKVPDVKGLSLRDAINRLEAAGLNVNFTGVGYVAAQSLPPGSSYNRGTAITLTLQH